MEARFTALAPVAWRKVRLMHKLDDLVTEPF